MAVWLLPLAVTLSTVAAQPAVPEDPADPTVPAPATTSEPATGTAPATGEPATTSTDTAPAPAPEPEPAASGTVSVGASATTTPAAGADAGPPDDAPVERAAPGLWGMQFTFGGLAPMSIAGIDDFGVNRLLFSELGFRRMLNNGWAVPFSIGAGVFHHNPDTGSSQNDVGLSGRVGIRKSFRVWRRIAPYLGGDLRIGYLDPTGDNNWLVTLGFGPLMGVEYFVGDRVSLLLQGDATVGFNIFDGLLQVRAATQMSFGGQMGLVFYF